jgi:hypothetical protein
MPLKQAVSALIFGIEDKKEAALLGGFLFVDLKNQGC